MKVIVEPPISVKVEKMKERVCWLHPSIASRGIDQTSMVIDDGKEESPEFSFMVIGDSGAGDHWGHNPQRQIAELMLPHRDDCRFTLHTGDVIYLVGSQDYYYPNFIKPYREFLLNGENYKDIRYDNMVFNQPFLPVLGNHDYYDVPLAYRILAGVTLPIRRAFGYKELDISWHGSYQGNTYAKAFIDYLQRFRHKEKLGEHLDKYYTGKTDFGRCLRYLPGEFTRLPNRYYHFNYGGIDFFALDSSTFNAPLPIPANSETEEKRSTFEKRIFDIEKEEQQIIANIAQLDSQSADDAEKIDDFNAKLEQLVEVKMDIEKQLYSQKEVVIDIEQLKWFKQRLIASWNNPEVRGRIVYFHHPPYVTEATKWKQGQTKAVRDRLREVFDGVVQELGELPPGRAVVDLILNGHAHCFEHLQTFDTGHADSNLHCIIAGGSGFSLRRQREEGAILEETFIDSNGINTRKVARCNLFLGRNGQGSDKHRPYSFVRIDVKDGTPPKFVVRPFVADRHHHHWEFPEIEPFTIN